MKKELIDPFLKTCSDAKKIAELPALTHEEYEKVFYHMSNVDMETTIRTINYAYRLLQFEMSKKK